MKKTRIRITNRQEKTPVNSRELRQAVRAALRLNGAAASLDLGVVDDAEMEELNEQFLGRRRPTDVLAFPYEEAPGYVEGEVVINAEQAAREAAGRDHSAGNELALYAVHGALHLLGYDDHNPEDSRRMRRAEREALAACGRTVDF